MGGGNVAAVFAIWSSSMADKHRDMRALLFMANTALDGDNPPRYFGGWEAIASALGLNVEGNPDSAERNTKKALSNLVKLGAITSSGTARAGVRAEYALNLKPGVVYVPSGRGRDVSWAPMKRGEAPPEGDRQGCPGGTRKGTHRGTVRGAQEGDRQGLERGTAGGPPRRTQEPPGGTGQEPGEEPSITSQRNLSTRGREEAAVPVSALAAADEPLSQQERVNAAGAALRAQFPEYYDDDLAPTA